VSYKEQIEHLAETTFQTNREIADVLGCSRRSVRRHVGKWEDRIKRKTGGETASSAAEKKSARILLLDIETSPLEVYTWDIWKQTIYPKFIIKQSAILSWAAKWLFEPRVMSQCVTGADARDREDHSILPDVWDLLNEANIVIAHNGNRFDVRRLNSRFISAGLPPPMSYRVIDTLRVAKNRFNVPSYSLDDLNKWLGLTPKDETTFDLWKDCVNGDDLAVQEMRAYNETDVLILEELYLKIRPWIKGHPNVGLYIDTDKTVCTNCGNSNLEWSGFYYTPAGKYEAFRCNTCGAVGRSRKSDLTKEEKARLIQSVAH
jgi:DNA-binding CsgD family transcriptional regulator